MASNFLEESLENQCQGTDCNRTTGVTYRVEENQPLCDECVGKKAGSVKHKLEGICKEHDEPIKYFCFTHQKVACQMCITIYHEGCELDAVKTVLRKIKQTLAEIQGIAPERMSNLEKRKHRFGQMKQEVDDHITSVEENVRLVIDDEVRKERVKEEDKAVEIEREAEEEIKKIKMKMVERLRMNREDGEAQRQLLEEKRSLLLSDVQQCGYDYDAFVEETLSRMREQSNNIQDNNQHIELLSEEEDPQILIGSQELVAATKDLLGEDDVDEVFEETTRHAKTLKFFHPGHKPVAEGRIDGFYGSWNQAAAFQIVAENMYWPSLCGCLNDDEIVFREMNGNVLHLANLKTGEMRVVGHEGHGTIRIEECVPLNEHEVVCLHVRNWREPNRGDTGDHFISVFDNSWKLIKDLPCPWTSGYRRSHIDIDVDGNVLAAREGERVVHIINPGENTMTQTTPWSELNGVIMGRIHALPSGDIATKIQGYHGNHKFSIIDRAGVTKVNLQDDDWNHYTSRFTVDPLTEMLYITYLDKGWRIVDQVSSYGTLKAKRIVAFRVKESYASRSYVIASGRLVTTDGENILVYKK